MSQQESTIAMNEIWIVTREYDGLAGAGGVKDVCRQLAETLVREANVSVILPLYGFLSPEQEGFAPDSALEIEMDYNGVERLEQTRIWKNTRQLDGHTLTIHLVEADRYHEKRSVYTYTAEDEQDNPLHRKGSGHYDFFAMNVLLQKAALNFLLAHGTAPDIIHCHDGHAALLPVMARERDGFRQFFRKTGFVVTIHNAGLGYHQEVGDLPFAKAVTGLPGRIIKESLLNGAFDPFIASAPYAVINTVSENYARELRESDDDALTGWLGHTLAARGVTLHGVTNGINPRDYDPREAVRLGLAAAFSPIDNDWAGKATCRHELIALIEHDLPTTVRSAGSLHQLPEQPLFTLIGRLTAQKGVDKLVEALQRLLDEDTEFQLLVLGTGVREIEEALISLSSAKSYEGRVCVLLGYDQDLAIKIYAAGDFFLIPSRYEPCGLTDYIAQLFGNLPIVHHVGGLVKVLDHETGFAYREHSSEALLDAMRRAIATYRTDPQKMAAMRRESVRVIHNTYTWEKIVLRYKKLYQKALALRP